MAETPYIETDLLLAVMNEDTDAAIVLAQGMSGAERRTLAAAAHRMQTLLESFCDVCDHPIPLGGVTADVPAGQRLVAQWSLSQDGEHRQYHQACRPAAHSVSREVDE